VATIGLAAGPEKVPPRWGDSAPELNLPPSLLSSANFLGSCVRATTTP